jgi:tripartite-type tricarboxylate transporter receptor subunit TctC
VVQKLSGTLRAALASKDVEETFAKQGATLAPSTPAELSRQIADEVKRWAGVVREAGIKVE